MGKQHRDRNFACPRCRSQLVDLVCAGCGASYPMVAGIPVLINEPNSLFSISDFTENRDTTYRSSTPGLKRVLRRMIPSITLNVRSKANFEMLAGILSARRSRPSVLVIGGAVEGQGFEAIVDNPDLDLIETDIAFGARTGAICDAHDLPFPDGSIDAVVIQAVLEHVVDPFRCVDEIHRVLKSDGLVYAETPFIAPVHAGRYDFLRFSHLAHRRLFRGFDEIGSGATCGPGTALAWSYSYFLQAFFTGATGRGAASAFAGFTGFWLKYLDYVLIDRPGAFDSALSYYFLGTRSDRILDDRDLISGYRGSIR